MDFREVKEFFKDTFGYIVVIVVVLFICAYIITSQQNVGPSMEPTLNNGDVFLLNKMSYKFGEVKRNDIIVFNDSQSKYLVKRVIGLPGERIDYKDNILYINNEPYTETFLGENVVTTNFDMELIKGCENGTIPEEHYLVLGDNRGNSMDSRELGVISKDDIIGKTSIRIWPISNFGIVK